ncbi:MAG: AMP-binding protein [Nocardioides sp.]
MSPTCFDALDRHVIAGHADRVALRAPGRDWTRAQLLEEVAAFGGVLQHCGVSAGDRVVVALPAGVDAVVAVLACARIGATHALAGGTGTVLLTASTVPTALAGADAEVVLVKQVPGAEVELRDGRDYDWDVVMRAGRTDPAACLEGAEVMPYDDQTRAWLEPLLAGEVLDLTTP